MTFENIQYTSTPISSAIGLVDLALFVAAPGLAAQAIYSSTTVALLSGLAGFTALALVRSVRRYYSVKSSFAEAKVHLAARGMSADLEFAEQFAVDSVTGKIAFVTPLTMSYQIYDRSDILGVEHQWVTRTSTNGRLSKTQNVLVFKTRNVQQPLYKIRMFGHPTGELWLARMNAWMNS
jgi:hypothetical protein